MTEEAPQFFKGSSDDFIGIDDIPNPRIPEEQFVRDFLLVVLDPDAPAEVMQSYNLRWIAVAGTPLASIDVIRGNQVIYTAPPLIDRSQDILVKGGGKVFRQFLLDVQHKSQIANHFGDQLLNKFLGDFANRQVEINPSIAAHWRHIFDFYNLTEQIKDKYGVSDTTNKTTAADQSFGQSYDTDEDA